MKLKPKSTNQQKDGTADTNKMVKIYFAVKVECVRPWEYVFVCGNTTQLGEWQPEGALEMHREEGGLIWRTSIELDCVGSKTLLKFRFFIGYRLQTDPMNSQSSLQLIISKWEAQKCPRCILPSVEVNSLGECNRNVVGEFGVYGGHSRVVMDGWLNRPEQTQILFRFYGQALHFFDPKLAHRNFLIRITPCDVRMNQDFNFIGDRKWRTSSLYMHSMDSLLEDTDSESANNFPEPLPSFSCTELVNLLDDSNPFFCQQPSNGQPFKNDGTDYFVFRTTTVAIEFLAFRMELFIVPLNKPGGSSGVSLSPSRFALAYCMPSSLVDSFGSLSLLMVALKTQKPIGQIKVDYLLARAINLSAGAHLRLDMETTFAKHWKKRRTLDVGHRGSGESFTKFATVRENTIHSLNSAAQRGAEFVEFDVQLSKDESVIVFHDFHVLLSVVKRSSLLVERKECSNERVIKGCDEIGNSMENDLHKMAVKDMNLDQLRLLHIHHYKAREGIGGQPLTLAGDPSECPELSPFPTLANVLQGVDTHTGFNIELKYPLKLKDGTHECENYFERNRYVDLVLGDVFTWAGMRRIVFSSFDPDICTLLSLKQNRYPVLFLCVGQTMRYVPFLDERSNVSQIGTNFVACSNILGINLHSEELLLDQTPLERASALKQVVFVWGEDLDEPAHVDFFRHRNVDAIIYDRIGEANEKKSVFLVEQEAKNSIFQSARPSPSPSRTNSLKKIFQSTEMSITSRRMANGLAKQMTFNEFDNNT